MSFFPPSQHDLLLNCQVSDNTAHEIRHSVDIIDTNFHTDHSNIAKVYQHEMATTTTKINVNLFDTLRSWCLKVSLPICTGHYFLQLVLTMHHPTSTWMWCGSVSKSSCQMPTERSHVSCHPSPPCPSTIKVRAGIIIITVPVRLSPRWSEWKKVEHEFHFEHFPLWKK